MKKIAVSIIACICLFLFPGCVGDEALQNDKANDESVDLNQAENMFCVEYGDGECKITGLNNWLADEIIIPDEINGVPVTSIGKFAFAGLDIKTVQLPNSVKTIEDGAFGGCRYLRRVEFESGESNALLEEIGENAFFYCSALETVVLPNKLKTIENYAFCCSGLKEVVGNTALEYIGFGAFLEAPIQRFEVNSLYFKSIDGVLYTKDAGKLISYPMQKSDKAYTVNSNTTEISPNAFAYSQNLETVSLSNVTLIDQYAFKNSSVSSFDGGSAVRIIQVDALVGSEFINDVESEILSIGDVLIKYNGTDEVIHLSEYRKIYAEAFYGNNSIKTVYLSKNIESIGSRAFSKCNNLESVHLMTGAGVYIADSFSDSPNLREIYIADISKDFYYEYHWWQNYSDLLKIHTTTVTYDSRGGSSIPNGIFAYSGYIVDLPVPIKQGYRFLGWKNLQTGESVKAPDQFFGYEDEITLFAEWEPKRYTVTLYTNVEDLNTVSEYYTIEKKLNLYPPGNIGYVFCGWYDNEEFDGEPISEIPLGSVGDKELYAKWTPKTYNIKLDLNYEGAPAPQSAEVVFGESFVLPVPQREGELYFAGWYYENTLYANDNGESFMPWNIDDEVTLTAQWSRIKGG